MTPIRRLCTYAPWGLVGWFVSGCGGSPPPPAAAATKAPPPPVTAPAPPNTPTASNVAISEDIRRACGIPDTDAYFTFDSSRITSKDQSPLDRVATCFKSGPLKGRSMRLVGHADPRGATEYNVTLGQARADAVAQYVDARGLERAKTPTTSRGAMDAVGTDEGGWAHDRRVDVELGN